MFSKYGDADLRANSNFMPTELELSLQKQEAIEKEVKELEDKKATLTSTDEGLEKAINAKKQQLVDINAEVARAKSQDTGQFERARQDNVNAAFSRLIASEPDLQNAELQIQLKAAFTKFDEGHFNVDQIYNDLRFAWMSLNRDKVFDAVDAFSAMPEEVRKQQMEQISGAGARGGSHDNGSGLSREEEAVAKETGVDPKYVKMASGFGPKAIQGGMLNGKEKKA